VTPLRPRTPPAPPGDNTGAETVQIDGVHPGYVYIRTALPNAQFFNLDAKDRKCNNDFIPDFLTHQGTSTA